MYDNKIYSYFEYGEEGNNNDNAYTDYDDVDGSISDTSYNNYMTPDDFDNFVTITFNHDINFKGRNTYYITDHRSVEMDIFGQELPTTDTGDLPLEIEQTKKYGGQFSEIVISGRVIIDQCGDFLTRKKYQIDVSSRHNFFFR